MSALASKFWGYLTAPTPRRERDRRIPDHVGRDLNGDACGRVMPGSSFVSGWVCPKPAGHPEPHSWQEDNGADTRNTNRHHDVYAWRPQLERWFRVAACAEGAPFPLDDDEVSTVPHEPGECEQHRPTTPPEHPSGAEAT